MILMDTFRIPGHSRCSKFKISRDVAVVPRIPEEDENDGDVCCSLFLILLYCESVQSTIVVDTMEHELQCVMRNPSAEALSKFSSRMADVGPWTVAMAEICARGLQQKPSGTPALLYLLATTSWPDHVVYAISQPLELLTDVVVCQTNDQQRKRSLALVAVVRMWEALERMRSHTSPLSHDTLWLYSHICPSKLNQMANVAVEILTSTNNDSFPTDGLLSIDPEVVQEACVSFLSLLLRHGVKDWIDDKLTSLSQLLEEASSPLHENCFASSTTVKLAMSSVAFLSLLRWKLDDLNVQTQSVSLVDYVAKIAFPSHSNTPTGPQWISEAIAAELRPCALNLLAVWSLTGENALPDRCWSNFLLDSWSMLLESRGAASIPSLLFLHTTCRLPARQSLHFVLGCKDLKESCRALVATLMNHFQQADIGIAASVAALLRTLLSDRLNNLTHDELSRSLWASLENFPVDKLLDGILKLATSNFLSRQACQPLLVCMMDVLELLVSYPEGSRVSLLESDTERVESLIEIISFRSSMNHDLSLSMEELHEETPPANNLSRLDESHISLVLTQESGEQQSSNLDDTIRIAAATILFRMGETKSAELLWRNRILTTVIEFASRFRMHGNPHASADMKRRLFRLQATLATISTENEDLLSASLANEDLLYGQERNDYAQKVLDYQRQLDEVRAQVQQLIVGGDRCKRALRVQAAAFERELQLERIKSNTNANQLVEVHVEERSKAERYAEEYSRKSKKIEELQHEMESRIEEFRLSEEQVRQKLSKTFSLLQDAQNELNQKSILVDELNRRCQDQADNLSDVNSRFGRIEEERNATQEQLTASQGALMETKREYHKLHENFEETFSQLSFLAQAYQSQEDEITTIVAKKDRDIQEARRQADLERRRNDERDANERHLQYENDRLTKKLARTKEKLEEERNLRLQEAQRRKKLNGPVSYINQLHTSTTSGTSRSEERSASREERQKVQGKENSSRSLSSSARREYR